MYFNENRLAIGGAVLLLIGVVLGVGLIYYEPEQFASAGELEAINVGFLLAPMLAAAGATLLTVAPAFMAPQSTPTGPTLNRRPRPPG